MHKKAPSIWGIYFTMAEAGALRRGIVRQVRSFRHSDFFNNIKNKFVYQK
jgi:hypothetical protein